MNSTILKRLRNFIIVFIVFIVIICKLENNVVNADNQEVSLKLTPCPPIDIILAKEETNTNLNTFEADIKKKLQELGVDTSDLKISAMETVKSEMSSTNLNLPQVVENWETYGAPTWKATSSTIYSYTPGGRNYPAWWGTALFNKDGYGTKEYRAIFRMVSGGQLNNGVCFNVTKNSDGSLNGYFIAICNHSDNQCRLFRFDHYNLNQAFDKGINERMWCGPHNNCWVVGQTYTVGSDRYKVLAGWSTGANNVDYDISCKEGVITVNVGGTQVARVVDNTYKEGTYGFWGNNCEMTASMKLSNINVTSVEQKTQKFSEVLRDVDYREDAYKFLTYVSDAKNTDMQNQATYGELATRLVNQNIHFIGWGVDNNKTELDNIVKLNGDKGIFTYNTDYNNAVLKTAEYIKSVLDSLSGGEYVILDEPMKIESEPKDALNNTSDSIWPFGKWKLEHDHLFYDNSLGQFANSGKYIDDFITVFDKVGKFDITYADNPINPNTIYVHRRPIANFYFERKNTTLNLINRSIDEDKELQEDKGILEEKWSWMDTSTNTWNTGKLDTIDSSKNYIIQLQVKDYQNTWSYPVSKYITTNTNSIPIAMFNLTKNKVCKYDDIEIIDSSYDPSGKNITNRNWEVYKDGREIYSGTEPKKNYLDTGLGEYTIYLTVTNESGGKSERVSKKFEIINDVFPPEITINPTECEWKQSENINVQFSDTGGSNFKSYKYAITDSQEIPENWSTEGKNTSANITINEEGKKYLHIKAYDNDNNEGYRTVGIYKIDHTNPVVEITADFDTIITNPLNVNIHSTDAFSGIKKVTFNGQVLEGLENTSIQINKNGTYTLEVEDIAGNVHTEQVEISNVYQKCNAGLEHPDYPTSLDSCPICDLITNLEVTNDTVTYNSEEQGITYEGTDSSIITEYYNNQKVRPTEARTYNYELKVKYNGIEYKTGEIGTFTINPKVITIQDILAKNREYNGTTTVELEGGELIGVEGPDIQNVQFVLPKTGTIPNKNVGQYNVTIPEITLTGTKAKNYTLTQPLETDVTVQITRKRVIPGEDSEEDDAVRVKGIKAVNRQYNATDIVQLQRGTLIGIEEVDKDKVGYVLSETGTIPNKDVGTYNVTIPEITLTGEEAENYDLTQPEPDEVSVTITKKDITIEDIVANDREYNGTTIVELEGGRLVGVEESDTEKVQFILPPTGTIPSKNVGTYNVKIPEITLKGEEASNYNLIHPDENAVRVEITKKQVISGEDEGEIDVVRVKDIKAVDRQYNATDIIQLQRGTLTGIEEVDKDKVDYILSETGTIPNKDVGTYNVTIPEITLTGEEAGNYDLTQPEPDEVSVTITKKDITIENITANSRQYNATNVVELNRGNLVGIEEIDNEEVDFELSATGITESKNIGEYNVVIPEITLTGEEAKNYHLNQPAEDAVKVEIIPKDIAIENITSTSRQYDGTNIVELNRGNLIGVEELDKEKVDFELSETGTIANKDIGEYNVVVPEITLIGEEASNYHLIQLAEDAVKVEITKRELTIEGVKGKDRKYDKTDIVEVVEGELQNVVEGEDVKAVYPKTGKAENSDIGEWTVTIDEITLVGEDINNYELKQPETKDILVTISKPDQPCLVLNSKIEKVNGKNIEKTNKIRYGDEVQILIKITNKGSGAGYAQKVENVIPKGMEFIKSNKINKENGWKASANKGIVETEILNFESGKENEITQEKISDDNEDEDIEQDEKEKDTEENKVKNIKRIINDEDEKEDEKEDKKEDKKENNNEEEIRIVLKVTDSEGKYKEVKNENIITQSDIRGEEIKYEKDENKISLPIAISYSDLSINQKITQMKKISNAEEELNVSGDGKLTKVEVSRKKDENTKVKITYGLEISNKGNAEATAEDVIVTKPEGMSLAEDSKNEWKEIGTNMLKYNKEEKIKQGKNKMKKTNNYSSASAIISVSTGIKKYNRYIIIILILIVIIGAIIYRKKDIE